MSARTFARELRSQLRQDELGDVAAMLAYYGLFALFPMMMFVVTVGLLIVPTSALAEATSMATSTLPEQVGQLVLQQVARMQQAAGGGIALGSAALALWGASRGSVSLGRALNRVYGLNESRPWWRIQLTGILVTLAVAVLLVTALGLLVVGPAAGHWLVDRFGLGAVFDAVWTVGRWLVAALLVTLTWTLLYHFLPDRRERFRPVTAGAVVGVAGWIGCTLLFALYVQNFGSYDKTYGALGAVVIFMTWLWLSNLALLAGAEIDDVRRRIRQPAAPRPDAAPALEDDRRAA